MRLICVSQGSLATGREFAERLASKLDYGLLTREQILERASDEGIAIGRLETAIVKRRPLDERLVREKEHYQAFTAMLLCQQALEGDLVYAGRTGHVLLPGVTHVLRVRVVTDLETRIASVMKRLRLSRDKAKKYIEQIEEDRNRWAHTLYNVDWEFSGIYDLVVNLEQVSVESATTALCAYSQLPEFSETPASRKALETLLLAARARVALARDPRTFAASTTVRASEGALSVSYLPKDVAVAPAIPEVLGQLSGVKGLTCSMAATNILWVQECFGPSCPTSEPLARIAQRWNAAVEILRVVPATGTEGVKADVAPAAPAPPGIRRDENGGIEDDRPPVTLAEGCDDAGLRAVYDELTAQGLAGGMRTAECSPRHIGLAIDHTVPYSLVVVGDVFTGKGHAASQRLTRELCAQLGDILRVPVIRADELKSQYFVTGWQLAKLALFGLIVGAIYWLVFSHQEQVLRLLSPEGSTRSVLAAAALLVFVPLFAYLYGSLAKSLLKLARIE